MREGPCVKCGRKTKYEFMRICDPCMDKAEADNKCPCCESPLQADGKCSGTNHGKLIPEINQNVSLRNREGLN